MATGSNPPPRRHLIIAGTGRSGTTFLVRYLTALGLDTQLSRQGESAWTDAEAQAGLEDFPVGANVDGLPYVIKNPLLHEFIDQVLNDERLAIDGVIIPVRKLRDAASSRAILERRAMYASQWWQSFMDKAWDSSGIVPGGLLYSLRALDEARVLATGFHLLVEQLVGADVPMVFIDFPRMIHDASYLFKKLAPLLPAGVTEATANAAHATIADPAKIRIEREVARLRNDAPPNDDADLDANLDRIALLRELARLREQLKSRTDQ